MYRNNDSILYNRQNLIIIFNICIYYIYINRGQYFIVVQSTTNSVFQYFIVKLYNRPTYLWKKTILFSKYLSLEKNKNRRSKWAVDSIFFMSDKKNYQQGIKIRKLNEIFLLIILYLRSTVLTSNILFILVPDSIRTQLKMS